MTYQSGKIYTHAQGLSCAFRQWRAKDSHCRYIHGYALQVELEFERVDKGLDHRNWVMGFGDLKPVKEWLTTTFDHKTLIAADDPLLLDLEELERKGGVQLTRVDNVGTEWFCKMVSEFVEKWLAKKHPDVTIALVRIREHGGNWASYAKD